MPSIYFEFKDFGWQPIQWKQQKTKPLEKDTADVLNAVLNIYGKNTATELEFFSHIKDSPWYKTYTLNTFGDVIPQKLIVDWFQGLSQKQAARKQ